MGGREQAGSRQRAGSSEQGGVRGKEGAPGLAILGEKRLGRSLDLVGSARRRRLGRRPQLVSQPLALSARRLQLARPCLQLRLQLHLGYVKVRFDLLIRCMKCCALQ